MTQPREYDLSKPEEISRLLMEVHGYMKVSLKDGTDHEGRKHAYDAIGKLREKVQKRELERARELISLLSSNARERALEEALKRIATDDCGCTPICQCNSESELRVWKEETQ